MEGQEEEKSQGLSLKGLAKYFVILFFTALGIMLLVQGEFPKALLAFVIAFVWTDTFDRIMSRVFKRGRE